MSTKKNSGFMSDSKVFARGLQYLMEVSPVGTKTRVATHAGIVRSNFYAMLAGRRPIPEKKRPLIAQALMVTARDIERIGMDLAEGVKDSLHIKQVLAKKLVLPEMSAMPDMDVYALNVETMETYLVGEAWTLDDSNIMAEFEKEPTFQARYIFKKKDGDTD